MSNWAQSAVLLLRPLNSCFIGIAYAVDRLRPRSFAGGCQVQQVLGRPYIRSRQISFTMMLSDLFFTQTKKAGGVVVENIALLLFGQEVSSLNGLDSEGYGFWPHHLI